HELDTAARLEEILQHDAGMKAVDKRPAVWRVEPGTVRALLPANVLVEPSDLVPQDHPPPGRRVRKEQAVRTESVGNRIDDHPVASRAIGRRQDLLIFLHDAQVAVEKLQDPWHDRLEALVSACFPVGDKGLERVRRDGREGDRKSTRLNSSHVAISYAV